MSNLPTRIRSQHSLTSGSLLIHKAQTLFDRYINTLKRPEIWRVVSCAATCIRKILRDEGYIVDLYDRSLPSKFGPLPVDRRRCFSIGG